MTSKYVETGPDRNWSAKINGVQQDGTVKARSTRRAAEAWAEHRNLPWDEEHEIEVLAEDDTIPRRFTIDVEVEVTYHASEDPLPEFDGWTWEYSHGAWQARRSDDVLVGYDEDGQLHALDPEGEPVDFVNGEPVPEVREVMDAVRRANGRER